ncbi:MAG: dicarboxylate/amino acid:cation symporter [Defluviitaleaceae bacterium]|nr:dicarboxylate/amino acid:cation symporter [Defluviitaleaceae bacterium]MCL2262076.1 dicarboxylate/amino acid:cation symporter [Defluviitaleaceae bacterium]
MKKLGMATQVLIAAVLGVIAGAFLGEYVMPLQPIGEIFLRLLRMGIVVLVLGHVIEAIGSIKPKEFGKLGGKMFFIFGITSLMGGAWGAAVGLIFRPGYGVYIGDLANIGGDTGFDMQVDAAGQGFADTLVNFVPTNIVNALATTNIMQILIFGVFFGIALALVSEKRKDYTMIEQLGVFNKVIVKMVSKVMIIAPIGVFSLLATTIGGMGTEVIIPLARFLLVYAGATVVMFVAWFFFNCAYCRVKPVQLAKNISRIVLVGLATASSAVTMPVAMQDTEKKIGVSKRLTGLVFPLGLTVNSTGAALQMALAALTVAQMYGITFSAGDIVYIVLFVTLASAANAVVPGSGIVSLIIVVQELGLPMEIVPLFAGVEIIIGMIRVMLNVGSDVFTAMILAKSEGELDYAVFYADNKTLEPTKVPAAGVAAVTEPVGNLLTPTPLLVAESASISPDAYDNKWLAVLLKVYDE